MKTNKIPKDISVDDRTSRDLTHEPILKDVQRLLLTTRKDHTPVVTVSYAQSLDGSIALQQGEPFLLSGNRSLRFTHGLRAMHDAILIGIGTVLADDPLLTVRLKDGTNPTPVIMDSRLRIPLDCKLFQDPENPPIIATTSLADQSNIERIRTLGANVIIVDVAEENRVEIKTLLTELYRLGINSLMVEGGSRVITSFFTQQLTDLIVLTIAPRILGGIPGVKPLNSKVQKTLPQLKTLYSQKLGKDLIVWGAVE